MRPLLALMITFVLVSGAPAKSTSDERAVSELVANIMKSLAKGRLLVTDLPGHPAIDGGWEMPFVNGRRIVRRDLQQQCSAITPYGWRAVPELLKWLEHKDAFVRYTAAYSLESITKLHPTFCYFGRPLQAFNGDRDWFDNAKNTWSKWYEDLARKE